MLIILPEFTIKLEDFSAFKIVKMVWGYVLQGYQSEWVELYSACCEEDALEKKALLDEAIMISQGSCCPECGETDMKSIQFIDNDCCCEEEFPHSHTDDIEKDECCPDDEICECCCIDDSPDEYIN